MALPLSIPIVDALIADAPLTSVDEAIKLLELLVDMTDPHDKIGAALTMIVRDRDAWKLRAKQHGCDIERGDPECG